MSFVEVFVGDGKSKAAAFELMKIGMQLRSTVIQNTLLRAYFERIETEVCESVSTMYKVVGHIIQ